MLPLTKINAFKLRCTRNNTKNALTLFHFLIEQDHFGFVVEVAEDSFPLLYPFGTFSFNYTYLNVVISLTLYENIDEVCKANLNKLLKNHGKTKVRCLKNVKTYLISIVSFANNFVNNIKHYYCCL